MKSDYTNKYTNEDIRNKFDNLVENYSNIETGQTSAIDSYLIMDIISKVASAINSNASNILDLGCGAGNYTIKILNSLPDLNCTLVDLSMKMLERAQKRVREITKGKVEIIQSDFRKLQLKNNFYDIVVTGTSLHHLRQEDEWRNVFGLIYTSLKKGGSFWISDITEHDNPIIQKIMHKRYEEYLIDFGGEELKDWVNEQMALEDTPRSLEFQLNMLKEVGFSKTEILHKNATYAAFGAIK
ncbi:class I SAM-dependent methyltransferase [Bacteroidota bacterium]